MNQIDAYAEARDLPDQLRQELCSYYQDVWVAYEGQTSHIVLQEIITHHDAGGLEPLPFILKHRIERQHPSVLYQINWKSSGGEA